MGELGATTSRRTNIFRWDSTHQQSLNHTILKKNRPYQIFLVEDNPGDVRLTEEAFKESGIEVDMVIAMDGEEAVSKLKDMVEGNRFSEMPDIILLDLNLPRKNGREVLQEVKQDDRLKHIPVIVLTTSNATRDIWDCYHLHANCFINKPVDFDNFFNVIKNIVAFWLETALLPPHTQP